MHGPVAADPQGDSYVQQLACEEDRPFSRYLLNRAGRDCAAADEQKPESALRTSIGRTLVRATYRGIRCAVSNTINSPSQSVVGTAACADPSEERLYRCSAGFSDFLISANVLAACKSRWAPRPTGLRPSVCAVAAVQHLSVQLRAAECLSPSAILFCGRAEEGVS